MPLFNLLQGMDAIEKLEPGGFTEYLKNSKNTICGRHPIGVLLNVSVFFFRINNWKVLLTFFGWSYLIRPSQNVLW